MLDRLILRINNKLTGWMKSLRQHNLEKKLRTCGPRLYFDDFDTATILFPRNISFGADVGFNVYPFINAMGGVIIGDDSRFGPFTMIHSGDHQIDNLSKPIRCLPNKLEEVRIGCGVWVGAHVCILRGSVIPDHCVIGAGTVIDRRLALKPYDIVRGNPAQVVGNRLEKYGQRMTDADWVKVDSPESTVKNVKVGI